MATVVVDSPRAWGTVLGGFIANFLLGGLGKSYGIIMDAFQDEFEAPTAIFTLTGGIIYMLMFILSLPNHFVVQRIGDRAVVMIGGISACISLLVASVAPTVTVWAIAIGGGVGKLSCLRCLFRGTVYCRPPNSEYQVPERTLWQCDAETNELTKPGLNHQRPAWSFSFSCVYFNIFSVVGRCFREKLGLANGLSVAGVSVGQMAFPSLVTFVLQRYGVRMGTLIMSAFSLHLCVTAALMPRHVVDAVSEADIAPSSSSISRRMEEEQEEPYSSVIPSPLGGSADDIETKEIDSMLQHRDDASVTYSHSPVRGHKGARLATALLIIYVIGKVFADNGDVGISFIAPPYGSQIGFSAHTTNLAIAVAGVVDLFSRLSFGWLTDKPMCKGRRGTFLAATWLVESAVAIAFGQITGIGWTPKTFSSFSNQGRLLKGSPTNAQTAAYYICFALQGVCSGTAMTQMIIVLSDWVGPERLAKSLAIMMVNLGLLYVPAQAVIGYLNDLTGSYVWSMRLCGLWLLVGGLVFLLESPIRRLLGALDEVHHPHHRQQHQGHNAGMSPARSPWCQHFNGDQSATEVPVTSLITSSSPQLSVAPPIAKTGLSDSTIPFICSPLEEEGEIQS
ncbi:Monocarboxylate transporter [Echinococcus granulosus]|uniref:Monocarboxylate transporter n=1 Tax=Echinococcus granulosus TaxID=6210 RepID=W6VBA1_ECHGR|nr:Monocarboxylate transporter [Echinococcus granulosus]EUB64069.1 Monocarboxylate transporter [Echinococcus granulosus]